MSRTDTAVEPRWLDDQEMATWLPFIRLLYLLPQALDRQLREEMGISHTWYSMLAVLSAAPDRTLSMGELARLSMASPSRLTHAIDTMDKRGWVGRRPCPTDKRSHYATITDEGFEPREEFADIAAIEGGWLSDGQVPAADVARVWVSPERARWASEAHNVVEELADGAIVIEVPYGSPDWLLREILKGAGDFVVLEPAEAREAVRRELTTDSDAQSAPAKAA